MMSEVLNQVCSPANRVKRASHGIHGFYFTVWCLMNASRREACVCFQLSVSRPALSFGKIFFINSIYFFNLPCLKLARLVEALIYSSGNSILYSSDKRDGSFISLISISTEL